MLRRLQMQTRGDLFRQVYSLPSIFGVSFTPGKTGVRRIQQRGKERKRTGEATNTTTGCKSTVSWDNKTIFCIRLDSRLPGNKRCGLEERTVQIGTTRQHQQKSGVTLLRCRFPMQTAIRGRRLPELGKCVLLRTIRIAT